MLIQKKQKVNLFSPAFILTFFIFIVIFAILLNPQKYIAASLNGAIVFGTKILPSLLPFFFLTKILTELNAVEFFAKALEPVCKRLFKCPGISAYVFITGIICGYPVSAKTILDLYENKVITANDTTKMVTFTSTSGPMFIIGTVASGMFHSIRLGLIILIAHLLGAVLNGILYRNKKSTKIIDNKIEIQNTKNLGNILNQSAVSAMNSILIVGVFIIVFYLIIEIFFSFLKIQDGIALSLISGIIEITRGCIEVSQNIGGEFATIILLTFIISFGGISVHLQAMAFLNKCKVSMSFFLIQKLTHAILACIIAAGLALI